MDDLDNKVGVEVRGIGFLYLFYELFLNLLYFYGFIYRGFCLRFFWGY